MPACGRLLTILLLMVLPAAPAPAAEGAKGASPADLASLQANTWTLIDTEDNSGGKKFARLIAAD
ncbi:hypothetical protein LCGC14_1992340, partial [marine sediment metagenome]